MAGALLITTPCGRAVLVVRGQGHKGEKAKGGAGQRGNAGGGEGERGRDGR